MTVLVAVLSGREAIALAAAGDFREVPHHIHSRFFFGWEERHQAVPSAVPGSTRKQHRDC
jgi:hypothetical protein